MSIASKFNVSTMLIGLTLVGFGTSMPELVTSVQAAMVGSPGIAVGNVVGSNIAKMLMAIRGWRITRREGALLVLGYVSYIGYRLRAPA